MEDGIAKTIEKLLFPSNVITMATIFLLIYLRHDPVFSNDALTVFCSLLVYRLALYFFKKKIEDENKLYCISVLSALSIFFLCYSYLNLSKEIVFSAISLLVVTLVTYMIRQRWKISAHITALTGILTTLLLVDSIFLPLGLLLPFVIWSRVKLKAHTPAQMIAGIIAGLFAPLCLIYFFALLS